MTFSGVVDDGKTLAGYSDENAFEMGFVGAGASAAPVRVMHEVSEDRWADVAPWTSLEHERRYLLLTGRRYRVVEDADSDNAIFEIRPPKFREVASVCSRKPSSYAIHLHGMTLDA